MSPILLNKAEKNLFERNIEQYVPPDPLYEGLYTTNEGKQKRPKRATPPGLSKRDARILSKLQGRAHTLDRGLSLGGLHFGWTFLIGLIPLIGDVSDVLLNHLLVVRLAQELELPDWLLRRMILNNAISAGLGLVPLLGDVALAGYKANARNVRLVEELLRIRGEEFLNVGGFMEVESREWFGLATNPQTQALSKSDVEQIKPGAGVTGARL